MKRSLVVLAALVTILGAACSSSSSDGEEGGGAEATTTTSAGSTTTAAAPEPLEDQTAPATINGITVDGDTIWVASIEDDVVLQVDADSGAILQRIGTGGAGPDDVALAPDGSVWTTGFGNGDLGRIHDGSYEVVTPIETGINPLEFGEDGTLFVGTYGKDGKLFSLATEDGAPIEGAEPELQAQGLPDINAFGVLADGTLVSPAGGLSGPSSAIQIDPATGKVTTLVEGLPPVAAGATDADGEAYVLANITGEVIRIDVGAKTSEVVRTVEQGAPFDNLAFGDDGTVYLSSFVAPTITAVAPDGTERLITIGS
ncbi:hypothetical protein ACE2AJ_08330 [Aquihabitans daechungensis]|uniref:Vgb family protein n=1 Tax=Aquihabitans daechungensis TaxID=1052257 RepID=UPI003BA24CDB